MKQIEYLHIELLQKYGTKEHIFSFVSITLINLLKQISKMNNSVKQNLKP